MELRTGSFVGVLVTGLVWAVVWALPGGAIEAIDNIAPSAHGFTRQVDMWMQTLGLPGLLAGVLFSVLILIPDGRGRLADLPLPWSGGWGGASGGLVGVLVVWGMDTGLSDPWQLAGAAMAFAVLMGAVSGTVCPLVGRYVEGRRASAISRT